MPNKKLLNSAFVSKLGRHNSRSIGKDVKIGSLNEIRELDQKGESHSKAHKVGQNILDLISGPGLKSSGERVAIAAVDSMINKLCDNNSNNTILSHLTKTSQIGKNDSIIVETNVHVGKPTTKRIKRLLNTPQINFVQKDLKNSKKDYLEHIDRKRLTVTSGFDEKTFAFFMEDHYISVGEYIKFFGTPNNRKILNNIRRKKNGRTNVYGAIYYTKNQFKFVNNFDSYSCVLQLHMIKINDIHDDYRNLIKESTNNKFNSEDILLDDNNTKNQTKAEKSNLREKAKEKVKDIAEDAIDKSNINKDIKKSLKELIEKTGTLRGKAYGKLDEKDQYSDPKIDDLTNKFATTMRVNLGTKMTDSVQFNDRAKIVRTWRKVLTPGSIWDFKLTQHYGRGVHLNYLYDLEQLNKSHPSSYVFMLELHGDARSRLIKRKTGDLFLGISPSRIHIECNHKIGLLLQDDDLKDSLDDGAPVIYNRKYKQEDFEEKSDYEKLFCPERQSKLHVDFNDIEMSEIKLEANKNEKPKDYILQYDAVISPSTKVLSELKQKFHDQGFAAENIDLDDIGFNIDNPPSESESEYEGTGGDIPTETPLDLDYD